MMCGQIRAVLLTQRYPLLYFQSAVMRTIDPGNPLASNSDPVDDAPQPTKMIELEPKESIHEVVDTIDGWRKFLDPFNDHMRYWFRGQPKGELVLNPTSAFWIFLEPFLR